MHEFKYKKGQFYCEGINISRIASGLETPFYLYSYKTLIDHYRKLKRAFAEFKPLICFSMKSNSSLALLKILVREGAGLDVVSGGELYKALRVGVNPGKIVYASVGKTEGEIKKAISAGILFFNVESLPELELINTIAGRFKKNAGKNRVRVAIRINPDVSPHTHKYITTSKRENKFGLDFETASFIFRARNDFANLSIEGLHLHIGSQITDAEPYKGAIAKIIKFVKRENIKINYLNIGGGLGIVYAKEKPQTAEGFAKSISPLLRNLNAKLILEPGRFIAGNSGVLVTRVLYVKETAAKIFVIVDAAMNDLLRPSLYGAEHTIVPQIKSSTNFRKRVDIVGPICESGDFLVRDRCFAKVKANDYLVVLGAGAYVSSMASNYNSRPKIAEALVKGNKFYLIRKRETYRDLIAKEIVPAEFE